MVRVPVRAYRVGSAPQSVLLNGVYFLSWGAEAEGRFLDLTIFLLLFTIFYFHTFT